MGYVVQAVIQRSSSAICGVDLGGDDDNLVIPNA